MAIKEILDRLYNDVHICSLRGLCIDSDNIFGPRRSRTSVCGLPDKSSTAVHGVNNAVYFFLDSRRLK